MFHNDTVVKVTRRWILKYNLVDSNTGTLQLIDDPYYVPNQTASKMFDV